MRGAAPGAGATAGQPATDATGPGAPGAGDMDDLTAAVEGARRGDSGAFRILYREAQPRLLRRPLPKPRRRRTPHNDARTATARRKRTAMHPTPTPLDATRPTSRAASRRRDERERVWVSRCRVLVENIPRTRHLKFRTLLLFQV